MVTAMEVDRTDFNTNLVEEIEALEAILDVSDELKIVQDKINPNDLLITARIGMVFLTLFFCEVILFNISIYSPINCFRYIQTICWTLFKSKSSQI